MQLHSDQSALVQAMYDAFSGAPRPRTEEFTPHRCLECDDLRDTLAKYALREIPDNEIARLYECLPLLSPAALRHFIPRYMHFSIMHPESSVAGNVIFTLGSEDWRLAEFSEAERAAVREYVAYCESLPDAWLHRENLSFAVRYWK